MPPVGICRLVKLMFNPTPMTAKEGLSRMVLASTRIPPIFPVCKTRSFGHRSRTVRPVSSFRLCRTAFAAKNCRIGSLDSDIAGFRRIENQSPPFGDSHRCPNLPLPCVCRSATTTVHSSNPFSPRWYAVVLVDRTCLYLRIFRGTPECFRVDWSLRVNFLAKSVSANP